MVADFDDHCLPDDNASVQQPWWTIPTGDFVKLNVDGSFLIESRSMATRGVVRDSNGTWLSGFSIKDGQGTVLQAELNVILKGLSLAWEKGWTKVICESDSVEAIHLIQLISPPTSTLYRAVIQDIHNLLARS
ncbi:Ribonuclease H-like superfamily [Sesbania bispinosa]|nr:Ribonuclease H-like superfamily [Sesbania bispinosa]